MYNVTQKLLTEAKTSVEKGNHKHAVWCCLDAAWYLLVDNADAQVAVKAASDLIYPKKTVSKRGWKKGRKRNEQI